MTGEDGHPAALVLVGLRRHLVGDALDVGPERLPGGVVELLAVERLLLQELGDDLVDVWREEVDDPARS